VTAITTFAKKFSNDWSMNLVSMLTYSLITSIFPLLLGMLSIAGLVLRRLPGDTFNSLVTSLEGALPKNVASFVNVHDLLNNLITISGPLALVALVGLLWTGSNLFTNMENAFSIIFRMPDRDFIPQRLMGIGMVVILTVLLPLSLAASSLVTAGSAAFASALPALLRGVLSVAGPLAALGILWLLFLAIYMIVPNVKVPFRDAWRGALTAAVLFGLVQLLFPLYFAFFLSGNAKYGTIAASALVLIAWLWFFALATVLGAQVNAVALGVQPLEQDVPHTIAQEYGQSHPEAAPRPREAHTDEAGAARGRSATRSRAPGA
jgi:membrane protein